NRRRRLARRRRTGSPAASPRRTTARRRLVRVLKLVLALVAACAASVMARIAWRGPIRSRTRAFRARRRWTLPARPRAWLERALRGDAPRMQQGIALGATLPDALVRWSAERRAEPAAAVAAALAVAAETGGAAASALDGLARSLRDALGARAEAAALSAQARLS